MTPRNDITWINLDDEPDQVRQKISGTPHGFFPVCQGTLDNIIGIGRAKDMITDLIQNRTLNQNKLRPPIIVHETVRILDLIERSEEHTSELQSLMRISYAVFCLKKKK